jgi:CheY-like chemotaxis protein
MTRVLVVDDDPMLRLLLRLVLENYGHEVCTAEDGVDALHRIEAWTPHVVVTDLEMPVMDGEQLVRILRSQPATAGLKIIVASAGGSPSTHVDLSFRKPYEAKDIAEAIEAMPDLVP